MSNGEGSEEKLGSLIKETTFTLYKLEARKLVGEGKFDPKNIKGGFVVDKINIIDKTHISAEISLDLHYGEEKHFFELNIEYKISCALTKDLERTETTKDDNTELLNASVPHVQEIINPIAKSMGYTLQL